IAPTTFGAWRKCWPRDFFAEKFMLEIYEYHLSARMPVRLDWRVDMLGADVRYELRRRVHALRAVDGAHLRPGEEDLLPRAGQCDVEQPALLFLLRFGDVVLAHPLVREE